MTQPRTLAAAIASRIFDRIERDKTLILQNIEDEIHDALVLDGAKDAETRKSREFDQSERGKQFNRIFSERLNRYKHVKFICHPWWQDAPGPEAGEHDACEDFSEPRKRDPWAL
jgi:hypothetical protein